MTPKIIWEVLSFNIIKKTINIYSILKFSIYFKLIR